MNATYQVKPLLAQNHQLDDRMELALSLVVAKHCPMLRSDVVYRTKIPV